MSLLSRKVQRIISSSLHNEKKILAEFELVERILKKSEKAYKNIPVNFSGGINIRKMRRRISDKSNIFHEFIDQIIKLLNDIDLKIEIIEEKSIFVKNTLSISRIRKSQTPDEAITENLRKDEEQIISFTEEAEGILHAIIEKLETLQDNQNNYHIHDTTLEQYYSVSGLDHINFSIIGDSLKNLINKIRALYALGENAKLLAKQSMLPEK